MIKYFTIYGERCSGTNFLMHSILSNFKIEYTSKYSWKHFFGNYKFKNNNLISYVENTEEIEEKEKQTNETLNEITDEDNTLFIGIVRDPIEWMNSFYNKLHHIPPENRESIHTFLFNQFYSIYDDTKTEIMEDRHIVTKNRYKNIFELRYIKNDYLINNMKSNVKNYILIRYEDLRDNYDTVLHFLKNKFNLEKKNNIIEYSKILNYKGNHNKIYERKKIKLPLRIIKLIIKNLNIDQEKSLGYLIKN
jgi:hypothetical protein